MTATTTAPVPVAYADEPRVPKRWTVDEYMRLLDLGVFGPEARVELIDGEFYETAEMKTPHYMCSMDCRDMFLDALGKAYVVTQELPITIPEISEPQPDIAVVRGTKAEFKARQRKAYPEELALLVEISDTTYAFDSGKKLSVYARGGVREYWIVNLGKAQLEQYTGPKTIVEDGEEEGVYDVKRVYRSGDEVETLELGRFAVSEVLPG